MNASPGTDCRIQELSLVHLYKLGDRCLLNPLYQSFACEFATVGCALVIIVLEQQHSRHFGHALNKFRVSHMPKLKVRSECISSLLEGLEVLGGVALEDANDSNIFLIKGLDGCL